MEIVELPTGTCGICGGPHTLVPMGGEMLIPFHIVKFSDYEDAHSCGGAMRPPAEDHEAFRTSLYTIPAVHHV